MTDASVAAKKATPALDRRVYLRMRIADISSEQARNGEEFRTIMAALPNAADAEKKTMKARAVYLRSRTPVLMEERKSLIAELNTLRPPAAKQPAKPNEKPTK